MPGGLTSALIHKVSLCYAWALLCGRGQVPMLGESSAPLILPNIFLANGSDVTLSGHVPANFPNSIRSIDLVGIKDCRGTLPQGKAAWTL